MEDVLKRLIIAKIKIQTQEHFNLISEEEARYLDVSTKKMIFEYLKMLYYKNFTT